MALTVHIRNYVYYKNVTSERKKTVNKGSLIKIEITSNKQVYYFKREYRI